MSMGATEFVSWKLAKEYDVQRGKETVMGMHKSWKIKNGAGIYRE